MNAVRDDNRLCNLETCTRSENMLHKFRVTGYQPIRGSQHGGARLSEEEVRTIRRMAAEGCRNVDIAGRYGLAQSHTHNIVSRKIWGWLN